MGEPTEFKINAQSHPIATMLSAKIQGDWDAASGDLGMQVRALGSAIEQLIGAVAVLEGQINDGDVPLTYHA